MKKRLDPFGNELPRYIYWHKERRCYYAQLARGGRIYHVGSSLDMQKVVNELATWQTLYPAASTVLPDPKQRKRARRRSYRRRW